MSSDKHVISVPGAISVTNNYQCDKCAKYDKHVTGATSVTSVTGCEKCEKGLKLPISYE